MANQNANYETPVGAFYTWEEAARACEARDFDPCEVIVYRKPADAGPCDICHERAYGTSQRLSFSVRVF